MDDLGLVSAMEPAGDCGQQAIRHVLVVDDSPSQRLTLSRMLRQCGYTVSEAASGLAALDMCRDEPPDLVFSDWMMPGIDGLEFCKEFRKMPRDGYGYFILLTSKSEKQDIARGFDAGADDFLTKPVNGAELRARITAAERVVRTEKELNEKNRLIRATLDELQTVYDSINRDLIEARRLQQSLVSERNHDFGSAEVSLLLRSSGHVGGDLVGMFPIGESHVGLYAIDVSGHGISSALMTARLAGFLSATAPDQNIALIHAEDGYRARCPAETTSILNELILGEIETEHYFTLLLGQLNLATGHMVFAQAGHPYPLVQRACGRIGPVGVGGLPVGIFEGATYQPFELMLEPGDRFLIHSDGLTECAGRDGVLWGEDGLIRALANHRQTSGPACLEALVWQMTAFAGTDSFEDDVSAVLLEFKDGSRSS